MKWHRIMIWRKSGESEKQNKVKMHVLYAERIGMQGVLLVYVLGGWCWREYAVSLRPGVPGMRGWFL